MPRIIDCHTHCYPADITADPRAWAEARNELHWADLVAPLDRPSIQDWATPDEMLTAMDAADVEKAVLLGWYWENEATCRWHTKEIAKWVAKAPDRFIGFASILPNKNSLSQLEVAAELGLRGVGELHFGVQYFNSKADGWHTLAQWCAKYDWPINLHVTEAAGHDHPGAVPTPLNELVRMAQSAPGLRLILAHFGGGLPFFEQNPHLRKSLKNVVYDCAASPLLYDVESLQRIVDLVGIEKLVFGSDYPLRLYPRSQKQADFGSFIEQIQSASGLSKEAQQALFTDNAKRLFKLC
ncbi:MAG: amidohydrolase family protein [Coraliomargarita sp.]